MIQVKWAQQWPGGGYVRRDNGKWIPITTGEIAAALAEKKVIWYNP